MKCFWVLLVFISAASSSSISSVFSDILSQPRNSKADAPVLLLISDQALKEDKPSRLDSLEKPYKSRNERQSKLSSVLSSLQSSRLDQPEQFSIELLNRKEKPSKISSILSRLQPILHSGLNKIDRQSQSNKNEKLPLQLASYLAGFEDRDGDSDSSNRLKSNKLSSNYDRLDEDSDSDELESKSNRHKPVKNSDRLEFWRPNGDSNSDESDSSNALKKIKLHKISNRDRLDRWNPKENRDSDESDELPRLNKRKPHRSPLALEIVGVEIDRSESESDKLNRKPSKSNQYSKGERDSDSDSDNRLYKPKTYKYSNRDKHDQLRPRDRDSEESDSSNRLYKPKTYKYSNRDRLDQLRPRDRDSEESDSSNRLYKPKTYKYSNRDRLDQLRPRDRDSDESDSSNRLYKSRTYVYPNGDKYESESESDASPAYRNREDSDVQDFWKLLSWLQERQSSSHYQKPRDQEIYVYSPRQKQPKSKYDIKSLLNLRQSCKVQELCKDDCEDNDGGDDCAEFCEQKFDCAPKTKRPSNSCPMESCEETNPSTRALYVGSGEGD